jgi:hypothetical protein
VLIGELNMSEIESQTNDLLQFQAHLERIFKDLDDGVFITQAEINDLRYACGLPRNSHVNPLLRDVINSFGDALASFPTIRGKK